MNISIYSLFVFVIRYSSIEAIHIHVGGGVGTQTKPDTCEFQLELFEGGSERCQYNFNLVAISRKFWAFFDHTYHRAQKRHFGLTLCRSGWMVNIYVSKW